MQKSFTIQIACVLFLAAVPAHAVLINLSDKECEEAILFGRANSALIDKELDKRYSFGSTDEYAEGGTIHSKWYKLALMAGYKAQKSETITTQEQSEILSDPYLQINIMVHGQSLDFAKGYTVSLLQRGREIIPDKFHADHFMHQHHVKNQPSGFPCYRAVMRAYFKYSEIDPAGAAILKVKKNGKTAQFDIDFARFR